MPSISAADVKALRERSGLPMMDCKAALVEADGDQDQALDVLRRKGADAAAGKAGRQTAQGRIACYVDAQAAVAALVEIRCETAPVANNDDFRALTNDLARQAASSDDPTDVENLLDQPLFNDSNKSARDRINETVNKLRENMTLARAVKMTGSLASYIHHNGQVGVLAQFDGEGIDAQLASDICMQIAAMNPLAVSRDKVDPQLVEHELQIAREQAAATGKPEHILDKIAQGKLNKWYSQCVLLEQPFVRDDKKTVQQVLKAGGAVTVTDFARMQVGQVPQ